jgi:hypothetical protein
MMRIRKFSVGIAGIILIGMAIFAEQIGLDNDAGWGKGRQIILVLGVVLVFANVISVIFQNRLLILARPVSGFFNKFNELNYSTRLNIFSFMASLAVFVTYIWFFLPFFPPSPTTNYYGQLAVGFKRGQLHLPEQPPPSLLALSDPYDYESRREIEADFTWDVSLYKGRFYIYWGPVPSLILTTFSTEQLSRIGDQHVFFPFVCGLFIYLALLVNSFWIRFNHRMPAWTNGISLLAIGLSAPTILMLNQPRVYEAAVVGCQFFFIGGCYWTYKAIGDNPPHLWKLAIASSHWAFALGTRITILPTVIFLAGLTLFYTLREIKTIVPKRILLILLVIGAPLLIMIVGLGLYNWARFDSVFEFGMRYQLANVNYNEFTSLFSLSYINKNLLNYFVHPIAIQAKFPYLRPVENIFSSARLAGLLITTPYFLFIVMPVFQYLCSRLTSRRTPIRQQDLDSLDNWLVIGLTGSSLISLAIILSYYFPALRFAEDFMPALLLLATWCLIKGYDLIGGNRIFSRSYTFLVAILVGYSVTVSMLIAIPINRTGYILLLIKIIQQWFGVR